MNVLHDAKSLYQLASKEFSIVQVEEEIIPFLEFVEAQHPQVVGEIGVRFGGNTFMFSRLFQNARRLFGLDIELRNVERLLYLAPAQIRMQFLEGSSYDPATVATVSRSLGADRFDFLFIDGDHEYDGALADFLCYYDMVRPGGIIAFHDIVPDEFAKTGKRTSGATLYGGGVYKVWENLKGRFEHKEFVKSWDQGGFGIGVLIKPSADPLPADWVAHWKAAGLGYSTLPVA